MSLLQVYQGHRAANVAINFLMIATIAINQKYLGDVVLIGTPIDLSRLIKINKPSMRIGYRLEEKGSPDLNTVLKNI